MKEGYIRQVEKELHLPPKEKAEVLRDLREIFASAAEHGETQRQVIGRLGTPKDLADSMARSFGADHAAPRKQRGIVSGLISLAAAAAAFGAYAAARYGSVPEGAIGQADAMTHIRIEGAFALDALQILLPVGAAAAVFAVIQIVRTLRSRKILSVTALFLMLSLAGCAGQSAAPDETGDTEHSWPETVTVLDAGVWPVNEYTEGLPVPPGTVAWAMLDTQHGNCSIHLEETGEREFDGYFERLKQEGFAVIGEVSETVEGQDYVSVGTLLSNEEKWLSLSYIPGQLTLYISFEEQQRAA